MSEWWTYRLSDFLMFAPRTYYRLFELYNAELWPWQLLLPVLALAWLAGARRRPEWAAATACALLAAAWLWVAWAFHLQRYATINWAANWFAAAFAIEALLLLSMAVFGGRWRIGIGRGSGHGWVARIGLGLLAFALLLQPALGVLQGRPWQQLELFGFAPDPTAVGTLGLLLLLRTDRPGQLPPRRGLHWWLWPIPALWCLISGATLWTLQAAHA